MTRLIFTRVACLGALVAGTLFLSGCAGYGEGYYGEAALPASYYYGPDYYDPGYPYYYHVHDGDWWRHHDRDHWGERGGHWDGGGREAWAGREEGARTAGHMERPEGGHAEGGHEEGGHGGAATAGGHIDGPRR